MPTTIERALPWAIGLLLLGMWGSIGLGTAGFVMPTWLMPVLFVAELIAIVTRFVLRARRSRASGE